jgi:hypothetical protein
MLTYIYNINQNIFKNPCMRLDIWPYVASVAQFDSLVATDIMIEVVSFDTWPI